MFEPTTKGSEGIWAINEVSKNDAQDEVIFLLVCSPILN